MAVQAQYLSNTFAPDFSTRVDGKLGMALFDNNYGSLGGVHQILNGTVFSDPGSELTCNASGSRKRAREDDPVSFLQPLPLPRIQHQFRLASSVPVMGVTENASPASIHLSSDDNSLHRQSAMTSTSGRPPVSTSTIPSTAAAGVGASSLSPFAQQLISQFNRQNAEIEALVRFQNEKLRCGLDEARKRHCRSLVSVLDQQMQMRLREKEAELESLARRNADLEEKMKQIAAENQIWFNMAKNTEAVVTTLRANLEQALLQNMNAGAVPAAGEGCGDSDNDAQSCCFNGEAEVERRPAGRRLCRKCGERDVCVLMLPCRHLCLCKVCESGVDTCPICSSTKNASLQIFMS